MQNHFSYWKNLKWRLGVTLCVVRWIVVFYSPSVSLPFFLIYLILHLNFPYGMAIKKCTHSISTFPLHLLLITALMNAFFFPYRKTSILKLTTNSLSTPIDPTRVTQISWHPRFVYINYIWLISWEWRFMLWSPDNDFEFMQSFYI